MADAFRRKGSLTVAGFTVIERQLMIDLFSQVYELLADVAEADPAAEQAPATQAQELAALVGIGTATQAPADPALARLLPDAHREDPDISADFRRYTELGLRSRKRAGLALARQSLLECPATRGGTHRLALAAPQAQAFVVALTDVRLVVASRIGLDGLGPHPDQRHPGGPPLALDPDQMSYFSTVYDFLTWLQESLVEALMSA